MSVNFKSALVPFMHIYVNEHVMLLLWKDIKPDKKTALNWHELRLVDTSAAALQYHDPSAAYHSKAISFTSANRLVCDRADNLWPTLTMKKKINNLFRVWGSRFSKNNLTVVYGRLMDRWHFLWVQDHWFGDSSKDKERLQVRSEIRSGVVWATFWQGVAFMRGGGGAGGGGSTSIWWFSTIKTGTWSTFQLNSRSWWTLELSRKLFLVFNLLHQREVMKVRAIISFLCKPHMQMIPIMQKKRCDFTEQHQSHKDFRLS